MKTTNIFHKLKASGAYNTDGMKPQLPGLGSPLDKKLVGNQKNLPQELKDKIEAAPETSPANYGAALKSTIDGKPKKEVIAQSITYDPVSKETTRTFSDEDVEKYGVKKQIVTKAKLKSSMAKKKSCGSPVKMDIEGRKPKTRRNKAQKGVNKMLGGLANANRGCKPHRKIKSR